MLGEARADSASSILGTLGRTPRGVALALPQARANLMLELRGPLLLAHMMGGEPWEGTQQHVVLGLTC
eukprot:scaffold11150_cov203-Skeletonema_marinoi.AAC.4